ncbi:MAG: response regulator [Desulfobacteraceae bacterium]|nr:response regulator [Desulfobacteraceae bacterium]
MFKIREIEGNNKIAEKDRVKILMVSSHSDKDYQITCLQAGCDDYIVKPFDSKSVSSKIEKFKFE